MAEVDLNTNFSFLILMLAIVLMALVAGSKITEIVVHKNGVLSEAIWEFVLILFSMIILSIAILVPYITDVMGYVSILLAIIKFVTTFWYYSYHPTSFFSAGQGIIVAELMSAGLIGASGLIFISAAKKETLAEKLKGSKNI